MNISRSYQAVYGISPVQTVETVREPIPLVTEYVVRLTPKAAQALEQILTTGRWPDLVLGDRSGQTPAELLNAIQINLSAALRERP